MNNRRSTRWITCRRWHYCVASSIPKTKPADFSCYFGWKRTFLTKKNFYEDLKTEKCLSANNLRLCRFKYYSQHQFIDYWMADFSVTNANLSSFNNQNWRSKCCIGKTESMTYNVVRHEKQSIVSVTNVDKVYEYQYLNTPEMIYWTGFVNLIVRELRVRNVIAQEKNIYQPRFEKMIYYWAQKLLDII